MQHLLSFVSNSVINEIEDKWIIIAAPPVAERFGACTGRREVPGSILAPACRLSCSEVSVVFSETRVNTG